MSNPCRTRLSHIPASHVWPFQEWLETDRACYLIRQYVFSNLYHRLSMRPFMSHIEKVPRSVLMSALSGHPHPRGVLQLVDSCPPFTAEGQGLLSGCVI